MIPSRAAYRRHGTNTPPDGHGFANWPWPISFGQRDNARAGFSSIVTLGNGMTAPPPEACDFLNVRSYQFDISHSTYPETFSVTVKAGQASIDGTTSGAPWDAGIGSQWSLDVSYRIAYWQANYVFNVGGIEEDYVALSVGVMPPVPRIESGVEVWRPSFFLNTSVETGSPPSATFQVQRLTYDGEEYNLGGSANDYLIEITPS